MRRATTQYRNVLTFPPMLRLFLVSCALALSASCAGSPPEPDPADEWLEVLDARKAISDDPRTAQQWADQLHAFLTRYPDHARAREVWETLEIEHATRLGDSGRPAEGAARLRKLLESGPRDRHRVREAMAALEKRVHISGEELAQIRNGLTPDQVEVLLGAPPPGWRRSTGKQSESWYYRAENDATAAVHFHDGKVISVDAAGAAPDSGS